MEKKERKIRKVGNSLSITLSKEFLNSIGAKEGDTVLVDEAKLTQAIIKTHEPDEVDRMVDRIMQQSLVENDEVYRELVDR